MMTLFDFKTLKKAYKNVRNQLTNEAFQTRERETSIKYRGRGLNRG